MAIYMNAVCYVTQHRGIIGAAIQEAIEEAKSSEVLAQAQKEFQELLDKTEKSSRRKATQEPDLRESSGIDDAQGADSSGWDVTRWSGEG